MNFIVNVNLIISVIIIAFLSLVILNHFFKDLFKLNPFYRNNVLLEGFDSSVDASGNVVKDASGNAVPTTSTGSPALTTSTTSTTDSPALTTSNTSTTDSPALTTSTTSTTDSPALTTSNTSTTSTTDSPALTTSTTSTTSPALTTSTTSPSASASIQIEDTDKSTIMADLFEKVNNQMDIIRTLKLSDKFIPINIDKTATDPFVIILNLKLLINNGISKNELDLKEMYDKYIGNKAVQLLISDINSVNMESSDNSNIGSLETTFLTKCQSIVNGHQKIINKILENKSKE